MFRGKPLENTIMKKILIILAVILFVAGCGEMSYEQRRAWSDAFNEISIMQHQQNLAQMQYSQPQLGPTIYPRQNNSNYYQEKLAQQQIWDNYRKNLKY